MPLLNNSLRLKNKQGLKCCRLITVHTKSYLMTENATVALKYKTQQQITKRKDKSQNAATLTNAQSVFFNRRQYTVPFGPR